MSLLNLAFCHRSYANETSDEVDNNEKLEFLGDSVLGLVVSHYLIETLPDQKEGDLARIKSFVVSEACLARIARGIRVENHVLIGKGEELTGGRDKSAILADTLEAIIGAYYLDSGYGPSRQFVERLLTPEISAVLQDKHEKDYKSLLQEHAQQILRCYPRYRVVGRTGPEHDKTFVMEVEVAGEVYGPGTGKTKKSAEQEAARDAYCRLTLDDGD